MAAVESQKPLALVVFLENIGHIHGVKLPRWAMWAIDYTTEEYAKLLLRLLGAHRLYDRVIILEDEQANGSTLVRTLTAASREHRVDLLLLVHGQPGSLLGFKGEECIGAETFEPLAAAFQADPQLLDLRMVYGLNCYGASLAPMWATLGVQAVNGSAGVNWLPEPSLSVFLRDWLGGKSFSEAVSHSNAVASRVGRWIWRPDRQGRDHPYITSSRQTVSGTRDIWLET